MYAINHKNEGHPTARLSFQNSINWSLKLLSERGGGKGGGTLKKTYESQQMEKDNNCK